MKFIWNGKLHRISFNIMRKPAKEGGLGISDLESYYQATNLAEIAMLITQQQEPDWVEIEKEHLQVETLAELVWQKKRDLRNKNIYYHFLLYNNLKIWDKWRFRLLTEISPYTTFTNQEWFQPSNSDFF